MTRKFLTQGNNFLQILVSPALAKFNYNYEFGFNTLVFFVVKQITTFLSSFWYNISYFFKNKACLLSFNIAFFIIPVQEYNIFVYLIIFGFFYTLIKYKNFIKTYLNQIFIVFLITTISFIAPSVQYFFMLFISSIILVLSTTFIDRYIPYRSYIANQLLLIFDYIGLLLFLEKLYFNFFTKSKSVFLTNTFLIYSFSLFYVIISKFIYISKNELYSLNLNVLILLYTTLFVTLLFVYIRMLLTASIIVHNIALSHLRFDELPPSNNSAASSGNHTPDNSRLNTQISGSNQSKSYSLFHYTKNQNHYYEQTSRNAYRFRMIGIGVAVCTLCIGGYAAYQQREQTYHTAREADVAAVDAGLLSKDEYYRRHPEDASSSSKK